MIDSLDFGFLKSVRFWKIIAIAVLQALITVGVIQGDTAVILTQLVESVLGVSIAIRTIDRFAEKSGGSDTR